MPALGLPEETTLSSAPVAEGAISILLIGPAGSRSYLSCNILSPPQWEIREAATVGEAVEILNNRGFAVAICDTDVADGDWQALLGNLQSRENAPSLIVSSRLADERLWAEVLNLGGYDVLAQPFDCGEVLRVARMAWMAWHRRCQTNTAGEHGNPRVRAASCR